MVGLASLLPLRVLGHKATREDAVAREEERWKPRRLALPLPWVRVAPVMPLHVVCGAASYMWDHAVAMAAVLEERKTKLGHLQLRASEISKQAQQRRLQQQAHTCQAGLRGEGSGKWVVGLDEPAPGFYTPLLAPRRNRLRIKSVSAPPI
jgi:hypothetical protein